MNALAARTLEVALGQVGVCEEPRGSNCGPQVECYLAAVGLSPGKPWCAAFVCWCVSEAALAIANDGGIAPHISLRPSGSALGLLRRNPMLLELTLPPPTAAIGLGPDECYIGVTEHADHVHGHAFLWVPGERTVEGNSNDDGSREGYEVVRLHRSPGEVRAYLRIA